MHPSPVSHDLLFAVCAYVCLVLAHRNPDIFMMAFRIKHQNGREQAVGFLFLSLSSSLAPAMPQALFLLTDGWASGSLKGREQD